LRFKILFSIIIAIIHVRRAPTSDILFQNTEYIRHKIRLNITFNIKFHTYDKIIVKKCDVTYLLFLLVANYHTFLNAFSWSVAYCMDDP